MIDPYTRALALEGMGLPRSVGYVPPAPPPPAPATREGQREIVAAVLAAGMIAAEGRTVTAAEAVERWQEMLGAIGAAPPA